MSNAMMLKFRIQLIGKTGVSPSHEYACESSSESVTDLVRVRVV